MASQQTIEGERTKLVEAVLRVLRRNPRFSKIEERNVKRILSKLEISDLTYLANVFDVFSEWLDETLSTATAPGGETTARTDCRVIEVETTEARSDAKQSKG